MKIKQTYKTAFITAIFLVIWMISGNLIEEEIKILSYGFKEDEVKQKRKEFENKAKERIKVGLILNEFGEQNKIKVEENEIQGEIQKQLRSMPGQEKFLMEYYQKNPSAVASLRGTIYEDKIINHMKLKANVTKKQLTKSEAEKLLKEENERQMKQHQHDHSNDKKSKTLKKATSPQTSKTTVKKTPKTKKVSKK